jgi:hypothetical protein
MSLVSVIESFRHSLGFNFRKPNEAMLMVFFVSVRKQSSLTDGNGQCRMVHVLYVLGKIEFNGQKGFMPIVLWSVSTTSRNYMDIRSWEVIDDRTIHSEKSVDQRVTALVNVISSQYWFDRPCTPLSHEIKFFVHGVPQIITHKGFSVSSDRTRCGVNF